jgi:magnesium transporter
LKHGAGFRVLRLDGRGGRPLLPHHRPLESELESIEEQIFVRGSARANIEHLYDLKRRIGVVRHAVTP